MQTCHHDPCHLIHVYSSLLPFWNIWNVQILTVDARQNAWNITLSSAFWEIDGPWQLHITSRSLPSLVAWEVTSTAWWTYTTISWKQTNPYTTAIHLRSDHQWCRRWWQWMYFAWGNKMSLKLPYSRIKLYPGSRCLLQRSWWGGCSGSMYYKNSPFPW